MFKKVSVVFLLVMVFVSCSEEEPSIIEVEIDKVDRHVTSWEYNDKISFNIMPIINITNGSSIDSITLVKDFDGIVSLRATIPDELEALTVVTGKLAGNTEKTNIGLINVVPQPGIHNISNIILNVNSFPIQTNDTIFITIYEGIFADTNGNVNKQINKQITIGND